MTTRRVRSLARFFRPRGTAAFVGTAAAVGVVVGLAAAGLIEDSLCFFHNG